MIRFDNTAKVQSEAENASILIGEIERRVAPIKPIRIGSLSVGKVAFSLNGQKGKVQEISGGRVTVNGQFHRAEEWKDSPWTKEEISSYFSHRNVERKRVDAQTKKIIDALR